MTCLSVVKQTKAEEPVFLYATVGNGMLTRNIKQGSRSATDSKPGASIHCKVSPMIRGYVLFKIYGSYYPENKK